MSRLIVGVAATLVPPCLEELVWETVQEVRKLCEYLEWREHFEYGLLEMWKLVAFKGRELALVQGRVTEGKPTVQDKGKGKAREVEGDEETMS